MSLRREQVFRTRVAATGQEDGPYRFGSGYRIAEDNVLTAAHVLRAPGQEEPAAKGQTCEVMAYGAAEVWKPATVTWVDSEHDLALVTLGEVPADPGFVAPTLGTLEGSGVLEWQAVGFPRASLDTAGRQPEHPHGAVSSISLEFSHQLALDVASGHARPEKGSSGWAGLSGAAVFCGDRLVGVVIQDTDRYDRRLIGKRISVAAGNPDFEAALGRRPHLHPVTAEPSSPAATPSVQLPVRFNLPRVTAHFRGRQAELAALEQALASADKALITQSISGLGGVGKSQLVARYLQDHLDEYDIVAWIRSELTPVTDLADLAQRLVPEASGSQATPEELAVAAKEFLERSTLRWLMVFDNLTDPKMLAQWAPVTGSGRVLATSRRRDLTEFGKVLPVDVFDPETGAGYLTATADRRNEHDDAVKLSRALGGLPLALSHAGAYCREGTTFAGYLELLEGLPTAELFDSNPEAFYEETVASTWQTSIEAACKLAPLAAEVLAMAAYLAPDDIPKALFGVLVDSEPTARQKKLLGDAFKALNRYSLIGLEDYTVNVHRLVQKVVRDGAGGKGSGASAALTSLEGAFPAEVQQPDKWPVSGLLVAHVVALQGTLAGSPELARRVLALGNQAGGYLYFAGSAGRAAALFKAVLADSEKILGPDHPDTIGARHNLASSYQSAGRTAEAIPIKEQVVADSERILGPDHPDTIRARNNLALSYHSAGRTAEAIPIQEKVVTDYERILGPDHPDTITARHNLASSYDSAGRTAEAIPIDEKVVTDREKILGPDHPDTITARNNLALSYQSAGRTAEAIPIFEQVVADREKILGPDHPDTILARLNLASSYWSAGRTTEAIPIDEQVAADYERILGPDHPNTITARNNLASSYKSAGRTAEAIEIQEKVVADREGILGPDHPSTILARNNLALSYHSAGRTAEAIPIEKQVVTDRERILGPDHPDTIKARNNLASSYHSAGRTAEAIPIQKKVVTDYERILGPDHPNTVTVRNNLEWMRRSL